MERINHSLESALVVEMNNGQMLEDVLLHTKSCLPLSFLGHPGGVIPMAEEILDGIRRMAAETPPLDSHPRDRWLAEICAVKGL
jgi:pyruvate/2-oxoacid:ferredoxin oxidoreductase alpha subunit